MQYINSEGLLIDTIKNESRICGITNILSGDAIALLGKSNTVGASSLSFMGNNNVVSGNSVLLGGEYNVLNSSLLFNGSNNFLSGGAILFNGSYNSLSGSLILNGNNNSLTDNSLAIYSDSSNLSSQSTSLYSKNNIAQKNTLLLYTENSVLSGALSISGKNNTVNNSINVEGSGNTLNNDSLNVLGDNNTLSVSSVAVLTQNNVVNNKSISVLSHSAQVKNNSIAVNSYNSLVDGRSFGVLEDQGNIQTNSLGYGGNNNVLRLSSVAINSANSRLTDNSFAAFTTNSVVSGGSISIGKSNNTTLNLNSLGVYNTNVTASANSISINNLNSTLRDGSIGIQTNSSKVSSYSVEMLGVNNIVGLSSINILGTNNLIENQSFSYKDLNVNSNNSISLKNINSTYTNNSLGVNGSGISASNSSIALAGLKNTITNSSVVLAGSGISASNSSVVLAGSGINVSNSSVGIAGSGISASNSSVVLAGSGISASNSSVVLAGSGISASNSSVVLAGSGISASNSSVGMVGLDNTITNSSVVLAGSGIRASNSSVGIAGSGINVSNNSVVLIGSNIKASDASVSMAGSGIDVSNTSVGIVGLKNTISNSSVVLAGSGISASNSSVVLAGSGISASNSSVVLNSTNSIATSGSIVISGRNNTVNNNSTGIGTSNTSILQNGSLVVGGNNVTLNASNSMILGATNVVGSGQLFNSSVSGTNIVVVGGSSHNLGNNSVTIGGIDNEVKDSSVFIGGSGNSVGDFNNVTMINVKDVVASESNTAYLPRSFFTGNVTVKGNVSASGNITSVDTIVATEWVARLVNYLQTSAVLYLDQRNNLGNYNIAEFNHLGSPKMFVTKQGVAINTASIAAPYVLTFNGAASGASLSLNDLMTFGSNKDVNLYRAAADTLKTDDSLIVTGNVGIGQTNPYYKLEVQGGNTLVRPYSQTASSEIVAGDALYVDNTNPGAGTTNWSGTLLRQYGKTATGTSFGVSNAGLGMLLFQNTDNCIIGTNSGSSPLIFANAHGEKMRIANTGNIGIGTTAPYTGAKLDVAGAIKYGSMTYPVFEGNIDYGADGAGTWRKLIVANLSNIIYSTVGFVIEITDPRANHASSEGTNATVETIKFNVACIRTQATTLNSPDACYVSGPVSGMIRAIRLSTGNYEIQIANRVIYQEYYVKVFAYAANGGHTINYYGGDAATVVTTQAIYNSSGGQKIEYFDKGIFTGTGNHDFGHYLQLKEVAAGNSDGPKILFTKHTPNKFWSIGSAKGATDSGFGIWEDPSPALAGTNRLYLAAGGKVGIGNTNPTSLLSFPNNTSTRKIALYDTLNNDNQFFGFGIEAGTLVYSVDNSGADHVFFSGINSTSRRELMRVKGNGNVGIGTAFPTAVLDVAGSVAVDYLRVDAQDGVNEGGEITLKGAGIFGDLNIDNFTGNLRLHTLGASNYFEIIGGSSSSPALRIPTGGAAINGNVGIGITSPTQRLHVVETGDGGANGTALFSSTGSNASIRIDSASTSYHAYQTFSQGGVGKFELGINNASDFYINRNVQNSSTGASIYINKSEGFVGVGTITPDGHLNVGLQAGNNSNNYNTYNSDTGRDGLIFNAYDLGQPNTWRRVCDIVAGGGNTGSEIRFLTSNFWSYTATQKMIITHDGLVGIGVAYPDRSLQVGGAIRSTGHLISNDGQFWSGLSIQNTNTSNNATSFIDAPSRDGAPDSSIFFRHLSNGGSRMEFYTQVPGTFTDRRQAFATLDEYGAFNARLKGYAYGTAGTSYSNAFQIREADLNNNASITDPYRPRLGFHWGNVVASSISLRSDGAFSFDNDPGTGRANVLAGWFYSSGITGWYNETYGGGWHMSDTGWIRTTNDKNVWVGSGLLGANGGLTVGYGGTASPVNGAIIKGNVGIGTSAPSQLLNINAAINTNRLIQFSESDVARAYVGLGTDNVFRVLTPGTGTVRLATYNIDRLTVAVAGNIGIGTTNPWGYATLDINGGLLRIGQDTGYGYIQFGASTAAAGNWHLGTESSDNSFRLYQNTWGAGTERVRMDTSGRVTLYTSEAHTDVDPTIAIKHTSSTTKVGFRSDSSGGLIISAKEATMMNISQAGIYAYSPLYPQKRILLDGSDKLITSPEPLTDEPTILIKSKDTSSAASIGFTIDGLANGSIRLGMDTDGKLKVGGRYLGNNKYEIWHAGNFTPGNYSLTTHTHDSLNLPAYFKSGSSNFLTATVGGYSSWWNFPSGIDPLYGGGAYNNTPSNNSAVLSFSNALGPKINLYSTTYGLGVDSGTFVCYKPTAGHFAVRNSDFVHSSNTFNTPYMLRLTSNADLEILNSITAGKCNGVLGSGEPKISAVFDDDNYTRIQAQDVSNSNYVFQTRINNVVKAAIRADGYLYSVPLGGTGTRAIYANKDGTIVDSASDERLKENIVTIDGALSKVNQLRGVYYNWRDKQSMGGSKCVGLIAQEVQKIIPEAVFQNPATGYYGVQYAELVSVLINAVNELKQEVNDLRAQMS